MRPVFRAVQSVLFLAFAAALAGGAGACTEVYLGASRTINVSARTFDFTSGNGIVRFSPAGVAHQSQYAGSGNTPLKWTSRYASVSFDSYFDRPGPEQGSSFTIAGVDGLNAAGLKAGTYFLQDSVFAKPARGPSVDIGMFMQYVLDRFATVDEAVTDIESGRYTVTALPTQALEIKLHLYLHDADGRSAIVEFLDGTAKIVRDPVVPVLTDTPYDKAAAALAGAKDVPGGPDLSMAASPAPPSMPGTSRPKVGPASPSAFSVIQTAAVAPGFDEGYTQWTIATDIARRRISFRTFVNPTIARIDLDAVAQRAKVESDIDLLRDDLAGDIGAFFTPTAAFDGAGTPPAPVYSDRADWRTLPEGEPTKPVDVFFVHPTTYFFPNSWNESLAFGRQNAKVDASIEGQASVFSRPPTCSPRFPRRPHQGAGGLGGRQGKGARGRLRRRGAGVRLLSDALQQGPAVHPGRAQPGLRPAARTHGEAVRRCLLTQEAGGRVPDRLVGDRRRP